jgi:hypothetical protein
MNKYIIYRTPGDLTKDVSGHELVGVEYGRDVFDAERDILDAIRADASGTPGFEGCEVMVFEPEKVEGWRKSRYRYEVTVLLGHDNLPQNEIIPYGILEGPKDTGPFV